MSSAPPPDENSQAVRYGRDLLSVMSQQFPIIEDVHWLVAHGASMSLTDRNGLTPLLHAMSWGNKVAINVMVRYGADVNYGGGSRKVTAMQIAAASGDLEMVRMMVDKGGDLLKKNEAGISALDAARRNGNPGVLEFVEGIALPLLAAREAAERHAKALNDGVPVEKPFSPLKPLRFRPH